LAITITVLYFAQAREEAGTGEERFPMPAGSSVEAAVDRAAEKHPKLKRMRRNVQVALNEEMAEGEEVLHDGDVVALIPPVAGG
jgi:molybdopterin synthase catalytic subunit